MMGPSLTLLAECRSEAFVDASVAELEKMVASLQRREQVEDRELASLVVRHRLVRTKLQRHRELCGGAL